MTDSCVRFPGAKTKREHRTAWRVFHSASPLERNIISTGPASCKRGLRKFVRIGPTALSVRVCLKQRNAIHFRPSSSVPGHSFGKKQGNSCNDDVVLSNFNNFLR